MVDEVLDLLRSGDIQVLGLLPYSSNYTFLAKVSRGDAAVHAVYKPRRGERPLWDFEEGSLAGREVAAYLVSAAAGWELVPPTVLRPHAPLGEGSLQLFIGHDPERHFFVLIEERPDDLRPFAVFDAVINNADRKGGHVIEDADGKLWAVDHGVTFHEEPKLRTVIWQFAEEELDEASLSALEGLRSRFASVLAEELAPYLTAEEIAAMKERLDSLVSTKKFPQPRGERPLPWPLI